MRARLYGASFLWMSLRSWAGFWSEVISTVPPETVSRLTSRAALLANADYWVRVALGHLVLEGVFERYPRLRVGSAEHELAWVPYFLDRLRGRRPPPERMSMRRRFKAPKKRVETLK